MIRDSATPKQSAAVVKLVDTLDLGSSAFGRGGSSPSSRTILFRSRYELRRMPYEALCVAGLLNDKTFREFDMSKAMKVKDIKQDGLSHEMEITIPANDIDARVDAKLAEVGKTVKMPGFRPGKVPMPMLKQRYGKAILGEVLETAVNETSAKAMADKKLKPAIQPKIEVVSEDFGEGNDLVYTVAVEVLPEIEIADLKKAKVEKPVAQPDEKAVKDALERIAENNEGSERAKEGAKSKDGDTVLISFDGRTADDDVKHEGMQSDSHRLKLGSGQFIPGFEEQLTGKKEGDKVEVKVSFPEEYGAEDLAGRDAIFDVEIKELHVPAEAKINDDFAKQLGMDDVAALEKAVEEQLQQELDQQSRLNVKKDLLDWLDDNHKFDVPPTMLEMEHKNILDQLELERQRSNADGGEDKKELTEAEEKEYKDIAGRRVRLGLILAEIGNANKIVVADQELQRAVIMEAQKFPGQEREVFDYYQKNPQAVESLRAPLFEDKVVDYILELAEVSEKEVTADELFKLLEDEDAEEKPKKKKAASKKKPAAKKDDEKKPAAKKKASGKKAPAKKKS